MTLFEHQQEQLTSDDFYTPPWVFMRMGITFDLDVCAPPGGIEWVPATRYLTMADDGLTAPWEGRVWMNPPYSKPAPWIDRFIAHRNGVCLVPFAKSAWFDKLWAAADAIVAPGVDASKFVGGAIFMPVLVAAFGHECSSAIAGLGVSRSAA